MNESLNIWAICFYHRDHPSDGVLVCGVIDGLIAALPPSLPPLPSPPLQKHRPGMGCDISTFQALKW